MNDFERSSKPNHVDRHVGKRLKQARERLGETPQFLAHSLKLRVVEYLQVEAGNCRLGAGRIALAAALLRVEAGWFFEGLTTKERSKVRAGVTALSPKIVDLHIERLRKRRK